MKRVYKGNRVRATRDQLIRLVRTVSVEDDVEFLEVLPPLAHYDNRTLTPARMIRVGRLELNPEWRSPR